MVTSAPQDSAVGTCSLCRRTHTETCESDRLSWVTSCSRYRVPIVALKRHSGSPTAGEWRHLEVRAKRSFPEYRWQRPVTFNEHFYLHAVDPRARYCFDHALAG